MSVVAMCFVLLDSKTGVRKDVIKLHVFKEQGEALFVDKNTM
jgi:hypothetical protein